MMRYNEVVRVQRVRVAYSRGVNIAEGTESKVYRVSTRRFPSGEKYVLYVWSKELGRCEWVREDDVIVHTVAEEQIHKVF